MIEVNGKTYKNISNALKDIEVFKHYKKRIRSSSCYMYCLIFNTAKTTTPAPKLTRKYHRSKMTSVLRDKQMSINLKKQNNKCFWCGIKIDMRGHLDHIRPIYYGGTSSSYNLAASCAECNLLKSKDQIEITNKETIKFYKKIKFDYNRIKNKKWGHKSKQHKLYYSTNCKYFKRISIV